MDGMNRTRIVASKIEQPIALTLDLINKYVYWVDVYLDSIGVVDYQGRNRQTIIEGRQVSKVFKSSIPFGTHILYIEGQSQREKQT